MNIKFRKWLIAKGLSPNSVAAYTYAVEMFFGAHKSITQDSLFSYKGYLMEHFKPKTVNLRIQAINKYLEFIGKKEMRVSSIKIQQKPFLENVISDVDYDFFKKSLRKDGNMTWYFVVRFLGATGARVSELIQFKVEHVFAGYLDVYSKGGKTRRIYIPARLKNEATEWLIKQSKNSGYLFTNTKGSRITTRGIAIELKKLGVKYGLNPDVIYPHSFRHRFAKNFIEKFNDIALLADLMGHDSIETTRIYLRRTSTEQRKIVDKVITW